jgi:GR25 family glycosyltransferase involved in LPS biosynthesis
MFYVINLARRSDRKTSFIQKFEELGISDPYEFVEAVDGVGCFETMDVLKSNNDYTNPRISATIVSHYKTWKLIAESDEPYGVVLEDDVLFHHEFKKHWLKIKKNLKTFDLDLLYLGMGDCLPIHTKPPSLSLLRAQEKSHVVKENHKEIGLFGTPNPKSPYIFDWFGAFSYVLTRQGAKLLVKLAEEEKIDKSVDVWIKESIIPKKVSVPLITYHPSFAQNVYDSDIMLTQRKLSENLENFNYKTAFLLVVAKTDCYYLEATILSILRNSKNPNNVMFAFKIENDDSISKTIINNLRNGNYDSNGIILKPQVCLVQGPPDSKTSINDEYNNLWRCYFRVADFFVCWDWDKTIISPEWDTVLYKYYRAYNCPKIACFQIESNVQLDSNSLNNCAPESNVWDFSNPFLTNQLLIAMNHVSVSSNINEYLKYICYLSKITIIVKGIQSKRISDSRIYDQDEIDKFYEDPFVKLSINNSILDIKKNGLYEKCGLWIEKPKNWDITKTIGESKILL